MKCVRDGGTCGLGGYCQECPHNEINRLRERVKKLDDLHTGYEKTMKRLEQEKSRLMSKNNDLSQKLKASETRVQTARSLLDDAYQNDRNIIEYDIQGVNQAHRVLSLGKPPKEIKLEE